MSDVGTTKVFENDRVAVWEMMLEPGQSTGVHTHRSTYFFHVLEGSSLETTTPAGESLGVFEFATGSTHFLTCDGDELIYGDLRVPATHAARNVGGGRYREMLVELKA